MKIVDGNGIPFLPFTKELRQIAEFLEERGMSAELINMTLAARAGLPIASVSALTPGFVWEGAQTQTKTPAPEAQPRSLDERRDAVFRAIEDMDVESIMKILVDPLNMVLAKRGFSVTVDLHDILTYNGKGDL